jgi:heme/copper-type cytochrome/quinol oxidase subunit 2
MQKKQKIILMVGIVVIVILALALLLIPSSKKVGAPTQQGVNTSSGTVNNLPQSQTLAPTPANVTVPNEGDKNVLVNVAVPTTQTNAAPGVSAQYRSFSISANNNTFSPNTVVAKIGDSVIINITAVDKNYDVVQPDLGLKQSITKGQTKLMAFSPMSTGKFMFYCSSCGGPSKGPIGYIIITAN